MVTNKMMSKPLASSSQSLAVGQRALRRKRIRLTRSVFLDGGHAEAGSIQDVAESLADDLIAQCSAVPVISFSRFFAWIWSFVDSRSKRTVRN